MTQETETAQKQEKGVSKAAFNKLKDEVSDTRRLLMALANYTGQDGLMRILGVKDAELHKPNFRKKG